MKAYGFNNTDKEQEWAEAGNSVTISGGNYSKVPENMNDLCADGYVPSVKEDGSSTVKPGVDANFAAQVGNRKYKTLEEAINAVGKGGTITLLRNVEEKGIFIPAGDKNFTIDFNNHKFTATELVGSKGTGSQVTEEVPLVISKTMVTMTCNNFNAVEDFEIPADAAEAV